LIFYLLKLFEPLTRYSVPLLSKKNKICTKNFEDVFSDFLKNKITAKFNTWIRIQARILNADPYADSATQLWILSGSPILLSMFCFQFAKAFDKNVSRIQDSYRQNLFDGDTDERQKYIGSQRTHRVTISTFWRTFHHDGKFSPAW
jgi:hypothetical protein